MQGQGCFLGNFYADIRSVLRFDGNQTKLLKFNFDFTDMVAYASGPLSHHLVSLSSAHAVPIFTEKKSNMIKKRKEADWERTELGRNQNFFVLCTQGGDRGTVPQCLCKVLS